MIPRVAVGLVTVLLRLPRRSSPLWRLGSYTPPPGSAMNTLDAARRGRDGDESAWGVLAAKIREVVLEGLAFRDLPPSYDADDLGAADA